MSPDKPNNVDITSVSEIHKSEKGKDLKTLIMEDFLSSYDRKSRSRMYRQGLVSLARIMRFEYIHLAERGWNSSYLEARLKPIPYRKDLFKIKRGN